MGETPDAAKYSSLDDFLRAAELYETKDSNNPFRALLHAAELYLERVKTYGEAKTTTEREALFERLHTEIRENQPELIEGLAVASRSGLGLLLMFYYARDSISNRKDLSQADMEGADSEAQKFLSMFNAVRDAPSGMVPRELVFRFGMAALSTGLGAGFSAGELRKLRQRGGKNSGVSRRAKRQWPTHAEKLAIAAAERNSNATNADIAVEIAARWQLEADCPGFHTLSKFVSDLRKSGKFVQRT